MRGAGVTNDVERALLGAALLDAEAAKTVTGLLAPEDFAEERHAIIFQAVKDLIEAGQAPDLLTVSEELRRRRRITRAGGASYISSLIDEVPDVANAAYYCELIVEEATKRRAIAAMRRVAASAGVDLQAVAEAEAALVELRTKQGGRSFLRDLWAPVGLKPVTTPPPRRRWLLQRPDGEGLLPLGRAGILSAEGGTGKTAALVSLAVSVATGRPWFDHFEIGEEAVGRKVVLLLGEEEWEEVHRRLWNISTSLDLSESERRAVASKVMAIPLAGHRVPLLTVSDGNVMDSPFAHEIRTLLSDGAEDWALIVFDPLSRFAHGDVEKDNSVATLFFQLVEAFCRARGGPTVLVSTHSSKLSRRMGGADVRGASGLMDAARWVATLTRDNSRVVFNQLKSNYSLPADPLTLLWRNSVLTAQTASDLEEEKRARQAEERRMLDEDVRLVVEALRREGPLGSKDAVAKTAGLRAQRGRIALDIAISRGLAVRTGTARQVSYEVTQEGVCVCRPPHTPRDGGTASLGVLEDPVLSVRDGDGTAWDGGTARGTAGRFGSGRRRRKGGDDVGSGS